MSDNHDHTQATHTAKCDVETCKYVAKAHAHDDDNAASALAHNLAHHNKEAHGKETDPDKITSAVKAKMKTVS